MNVFVCLIADMFLCCCGDDKNMYRCEKGKFKEGTKRYVDQGRSDHLHKY